ncbi:hypothetical protein Nepgr_021557 [Nepenthes gracilis]|uniref:Uncharacterized protein n=1 Tax=Nepenthes gracilis TaxID=150966 RepID=A0AAD3T150_NEPGR|nr:hypothetical protein Nepgr_021557 [Nepenthes gracilis]
MADLLTLLPKSLSSREAYAFLLKVTPSTSLGLRRRRSFFKFSGREERFFPVIRSRRPKHVFFHCNSSTNSNDGWVHFNHSGAILSFFRELGLNEKESEAILDKNPDLGLSTLESIRYRVHLLQSVVVNGIALSRLIAKCPDILTSEEVDSLINFLHQDLGNKIESDQVHRLLMGTEPRFLAGFGLKVKLLVDHGVVQEKIAHVLNNVNLIKAICLKSVEEIGRTISFLHRYGCIDIIVKRPATLNYDLDNQLIPRAQFLRDLSGGDEDAAGEVLRRMPAILSYTVKHMEGHVQFLRSIAGLTDEEIFKIVLVFPSIMSASKERKLRPRIHFLKQCGLDSDDIYRFLTKSPLFLGLSFKGNLSHKLGLLVKIGYAYRTKEMAMAMGASTRTSCENLQKGIGLFLSYGFSYDDIVSMSKKHPQILQYNPNSLEEKMEYLIQEMGREIGELLSFPAFLGYDLDSRIKHRYEAKKMILGEEMSINKLLSVSTKRFSKAKKHENQFSEGGR